MAIAFDGWTSFGFTFLGDGSPLTVPHAGVGSSPILRVGTGGISGAPRGVLISVAINGVTTPQITTLEVGPSSSGPWTVVPRFALAQDTTVEVMCAAVYFLGVGVPVGDLWVRFTGAGNASHFVMVSTFTASGPTSIADYDVREDDQDDPQITLDTSVDVSERHCVFMSALNSFGLVTPSAGVTMLKQWSAATETAHFLRTTTPVAGSAVIGVVTNGVEDVAMVAVAIRENIAAGVTDSDPSSVAMESAYFQAQKESISRTRALAATMKVTECANAYAQSIRQWLQHTDEFDDAAWTKSGGATVDANVFIGPDNDVTVTGDRLNFAADADYVQQDTTGNVVTSRTFTVAVWLVSAIGDGTIELTLQNVGGTETVTLVCNVTATWTRFSIQKQFSGTPVDAVRVRIGRGTGGLSEVGAWRANVTQNPTNDGLLCLFPTVRREAESVDTVATMAGRCQAADAGNGFRCYKSAPTCQDSANFNTGHSYEATDALRGLRAFRFCSAGTPLPVAGETFHPMIESGAFASQEIYPDKTVTLTSDLKMRMFDDTPRDVWNLRDQQAGFLTNTTTPTGTFWKRFRTIHRNFANPRNTMTIYESFPGAGAGLADLAIRGTYLLHSMIMTQNVMEIELTDPLRMLRTKAPAKISNTNVVTATMSNSVTSVKVTDVSPITPLPDLASGYPYPLVIQIDYDAAPEYCNVLAIDEDTNTFTVQRGRWGSTAVVHPYGCKWREVLMLGTENTTPASPPRGKNPFDCLMELLHRGFGNLQKVAVATLEAERDTYLPGGVRNNQNWGTVFRRAGGTIGTANSAIADPKDIEILLRSLRESAQIELWQNKDQVITGRKAGPLRPSVSMVELTDTSDLVANSTTVDENETTRFSRILVAYGLKTDRSGDAVEDYNNYVVVVNADAERPGFDGEARTLNILSPWILEDDDITPQTLGLQLMSRFSVPVRKAKLSVELRNDYLQVGTTVQLTSDEIQDASGAGVSKRQFYILRRAPATDTNKVELLVQDEALQQRFAWIYDGADVLYDAATDEQKRYGFIADEKGLVGTTSRAEGFRIWPI